MIVGSTIVLTTGMRLRHSSTSTFPSHFLAAFLLGGRHRLGWRDAIQQWQSKQKNCHAPNAEFGR